MSPKYTATLQELRQQRGLLDQAITALELLNGERPLPEITVTQLIEPARSPKLLAATRRVKPAKATPAVGGGKRAVPALRSPTRENATSDDDAVMKAIRSCGGSARKAEILNATKLPIDRVNRSRVRLVARGAIVVRGWAHAARWSLPATKEAP